MVMRARIVLLAAGGTANSAIAGRLGICEDTARKWRRRYCEQAWTGWRMPRGPAGRASSLPGSWLR
jgi:transposase-like protein